MAGTGKKWLLGCGLGCGIPVLVVVILGIVGSARMMKPFDGAVAAQKELTELHGTRDGWSPPAESLAPARLEAFLAVRRNLAPLCAEFAEIGRKFERMDQLDSQEDPSKTEMFKAVGDLMGGVFGMVGDLGRFSEERNRALLAQEMGLGEYIWIYALSYHSLLGHAPNRDFESGGGAYSGREQKLLRQMMDRHAVALAAAGRNEEAELWRAELSRLERTEGSGVLWPDGDLPAAIVASLEPYRDELEDLYCAETSTFEFSRVQKKGLSINAN